MDVPVARSSHARPTVTGGGIGLALALCLSLLLISVFRHGHPQGEIGLFSVATVVVAAVGLWDVYRDPPGHWRLFLELGAAGMVMGAGMGIYQFQMPWGPSFALWWAAVPLTLLWMTGVTNLYNFIDGVDGLASILGIVYASGIAVAAFTTGHPDEVLVALVVAAACLGFLWFNFPPARVFMGDVGSLTLGFVFSVLAMRLSASSLRPVPLVFFLILYSSFLFDTSYTILRRAFRGEEFWLAHRTHLYERLNRIGWSHLHVTLLYLGLGLVSLLLALGYLRAGPAVRTALVGLQLLICAGQLVFVKAVEGSEYVLIHRRPKPTLKQQ